jgi:hypothetical protein
LPVQLVCDAPKGRDAARLHLGDDGGQVCRYGNRVRRPRLVGDIRSAVTEMAAAWHLANTRAPQTKLHAHIRMPVPGLKLWKDTSSGESTWTAFCYVWPCASFQADHQWFGVFLSFSSRTRAVLVPLRSGQITRQN